MVLGSIDFDQVWRFSDVDAQYHKPLVLVALIERFESGPLSQTVGSPGGPKAHEHHLPFKRPQGDLPAFQIWEADVWQRHSAGQALKLCRFKRICVGPLDTNDAPGEPQAKHESQPEYALLLHDGMPFVMCARLVAKLVQMFEERQYLNPNGIRKQKARWRQTQARGLEAY